MLGSYTDFILLIPKFIFDERRRLDVEMDVGKPLLDIETWTLLVDTGEISVA